MVAESIDAEISAIAKLYTFREPDAVRLFLKRNPRLAGLLEATRPAIDRTFGKHVTEVFLQSVYDVEEQYESLLIRVRVDLDAQGALELLHRFDREWWWKASERFFGDIQVLPESVSIVRP